MQKNSIPSSKIGWTQQEQIYLEILCKNQKVTDWKQICLRMNAVFFEKSRTSKQCRQRFHNYIRYKGEQNQDSAWTPEEDHKLLEKYIEMGSKWAQISKSIPKRSQNSIKNRFYGRLRKFIRSINEVLRKSSQKNKKPIKQNAIIKILSKQNTVICRQKSIQEQSPDDNQVQLEKLKYDIVRSLLSPEIQVAQEHKLDILQRIQQYASLTKTKHRTAKKTKRKLLPPVRKELSHPQPDLKSIEQHQSKSQKEQIRETTKQNFLSQFLSLKSYRFEEEFQQYLRNSGALPELVEIDISFFCGQNKTNFERDDQFSYS